MKILLVLFTLLFVSSIAAQKPIKLPIDKPPVPPKEKTEKIKIKKNSVEERLKSYFYRREVKPAIIVNNLNHVYRENEEETIDIANHKIVWIYSLKETKIKIDDDIFSLEGKKTLNFVEDQRNDDVDFANNWDQIKLFRFGDRELIGISMYNEPCTGIGCRVAMYLIYDLKTKTKNFFGTYRFLLDREFGLYDFGNDGNLDFLSGTYDDGNDGKRIEFKNIYQIFTMNDAGFFRLQTDQKGKAYFVKRVYKENDNAEIDSKFEHYWIEEIK